MYYFYVLYQKVVTQQTNNKPKNQILNIHTFVPFVYPQDGKAAKAPAFERLTYADAGVYVCEVATGTLKRSLNFQLVVEGEHCPPSSTPPTV